MTSYIGKYSVLASLLLAGCAQVGPQQYAAQALTPADQAYVSSQPEYLRADYTRLFEEGGRNQVLNLMIIGKKAFATGDFPSAARAFDQAIAAIESVYANSDSAAKARSLWYEEGSKDFKGEPYERSMVYYYRGLTYLAQGQPDNARASFLNAIMQDAFAEEQQNRSDMGSQLLLIGWTSMIMGRADLADQAFQELEQLQPDFVRPTPADTTLIIAEAGYAPRKLADGVGHHQLIYRRGKNQRITAVEFDKAGQLPVPMTLREDIFWQASSRGGRPVDRIIEGQYVFKSTTQAAGAALSDVGRTALYLSPAFGQSTANLGAGISLLGVGVMAISAQTKVRADTRYWPTLPDKLYINAKALPENADIDLVYRLKEGGQLTQDPNFIISTKGYRVIWSQGE